MPYPARVECRTAVPGYEQDCVKLASIRVYFSITQHLLIWALEYYTLILFLVLGFHYSYLYRKSIYFFSGSTPEVGYSSTCFILQDYVLENVNVGHVWPDPEDKEHL